MIAVSLTGWFFASAGVPAHADEQEGKLEVDKVAYWTDSLGKVAPNALTTQFPPGAVCLVAPQFCSDDAEDFAKPINDLVKDNQPEDTIPVTPVDGVLVPEGTLPTSSIAGARRYESALAFQFPEIADNFKFDNFTIELAVTDPTFHFDSPAFRQFVTGVLAMAREDTSELPKTRDRKPFVTDEFVGVEACPIVVPWESGDNQPASDAPSKEGGGRNEVQEINCVYGANGKMDGNSMSFDLTLAANAATENRLHITGVLLRPTLPPNLAYGDPDLSTWEQISFVDPKDDSSAASFTMEISEKPKLLDFGGFPTLGGSTGGDSGSGAVVAGESTTSGSDGGLFGSPAASTTDLGSSDGGVAAPVGDAFTPAAPAGLSNPVTSGWTWMLLPLFLGGMYLTSQAFVTEGAVMVERSGAMTRLIRLQETRAATAQLVD